MRLVLISSVYPPLCSSSAIQTRDLSIEFARQGHEITMIVASPEIEEAWRIESWNGVRVVRLKTPPTTGLALWRRAIGEFLMPVFMLRRLRASPLRNEKWDGVVWYSPTIFLGLVVSAIKSSSKCKAYLIIRDIFPDWAADIGLIGRGLTYRVFKSVANYQYSIADVIGIQSEGNRVYFYDWVKYGGRRVEVLQNWFENKPAAGCSISINKTELAGRKIFVYAGNMGLAQGAGILIDLAERLKPRTDIGFLFVGRGTDATRLHTDAKQRGLNNVAFFDEIDADEIPGLYAQCHVGLVALDTRHKTHNIPGKFLSYMQGGLPVLASINPGNDLVEMILREDVGRVCTDLSLETLQRLALDLMDEVAAGSGSAGNVALAKRCKTLSAKLFSPETAVRQIVAALAK